MVLPMSSRAFRLWYLFFDVDSGEHRHEVMFNQKLLDAKTIQTKPKTDHESDTSRIQAEAVAHSTAQV